MERIFPFKNLTVNTLWDFMKNDFIDHYFWEFKTNNSETYKEFVEGDIRRFRDSLADFENEILQIVNTTNQETIDFYFGQLKGNVERIKQIDKSELLGYLTSYNDKIYDLFLEKVEREAEKYFKEEERTKYKNLEEYETDYFGGGLLLAHRDFRDRKKIKVVNHNFYCIEEIPELVDFKYFDDYYNLVNSLSAEFLSIADKFISLYDQGKVKADVEKFFNKAVIYVEGDHDIKLIFKAAKFLGYEKLLDKVEIRQRNGFRNLDKIWEFYKNNSLEIIAQKKILLYDCDTAKQDENFGNYLFKRTIPTFNGHLISKGIENLFSNYTVQKAIKEKKEFIDFNSKKGVVRGKEYYEEANEVNKDEKANFCDWICKSGTKEDFKNFEIIFKIIDDILENRIA
jgi:hypothetical protein